MYYSLNILFLANLLTKAPLQTLPLTVTPQVTQAHSVCHKGKYREHMRRSLGLEICKKMEIKIDETYHVVSCCCL